MTPTETVTILRRYNVWRRGNLEGMPQPDPREIGEIAWSNDSKWQSDRAHAALEESK